MVKSRISENISNGSFDRLNIRGVCTHVVAEGHGERIVIYLAGDHGDTDTLPDGSIPEIAEVTTTKIKISVMENLHENDGLSISGGEPMHQVVALVHLLNSLRAMIQDDIWLRTQYEYEDLIEIPLCKELLKYIDVLICGEIDMTRPSKLVYKESRNQRLIDVQESMVIGKTVIYNV